MKPNLLYIMTDQHRFGAVGANGDQILQTPHLVRLAESGVNLRCYFSNCPVCVPSRCKLFTGRYPHWHRVRENRNRIESDRGIHMSRVLKKADCAVACGVNHESSEGEEAGNAFVAAGVRS